MTLSQLLRGQQYQLVQGSTDIEISDIIYDTRKLKPGALFVCVVGTQRDSHDLAAQAVEQGAAALLTQHPVTLPEGCNATVIQVENSRYGMALASAEYFGQPGRQMTLIGVTGTKGKTTTAHMIRSVLTAAGCSTGQGHNSCASAIKEYYEKQGEICEHKASLSSQISPCFS